MTFSFWFRFVYPNLPDLEIGLVNEVFSRISGLVVKNKNPDDNIKLHK